MASLSAVVIAVAVCAAGATAAAFDYEACRASIGAQALDDALMQYLTRDLLEASRLQARGWNFNRPHSDTAVNLLLPQEGAASTWDAKACNGVAQLPRCWSIPSQTTIVCNPGFTQWLRKANYFGPPMRLEVVLAGRFMMQSILGHEISHLERGDSGPQHMRPDADALRCSPLPVIGPTAETACDDRGAQLACATALKSDAWRMFREQKGNGSIESVYDFIIRVRREIRDFDPADDACTGGGGYESFSLRRRKLSLDLLRCLVEWKASPFSQALEEEVDEFSRIEEALRATQTFVAGADPDGGFSLEPAVEALGDDVYLVSGEVKGRGRLLLLRRSNDAMVWRDLAADVPGAVWAMRQITPTAWELIFRRYVERHHIEGQQLTRAVLSCPHGAADPDACSVSQRESGPFLPQDALVVAADDGGIVVATQPPPPRVRRSAPMRVSIYANAVAPRPETSHAPAFSQSEVKLAAIRDRELAVTAQFERKGLYMLEITTRKAQTSKLWPLDKSCWIHDIDFNGDRFLATAVCDQPSEGAHLLLSCPAAALVEPGRELPLSKCSTRVMDRLASPNQALLGESMALALDLERPPASCDAEEMVEQYGWTYLRRRSGEESVVPVDHVIACDWNKREMVGYRAGKLNWLVLPADE